MAAMIPPNISSMLAQGSGAPGTPPSPAPAPPPPASPMAGAPPAGMNMMQMMTFLAGVGFPQLIANMEKMSKIGQPKNATHKGVSPAPPANAGGATKQAAITPSMTISPMIARILAMRRAQQQPPSPPVV